MKYAIIAFSPSGVKIGEKLMAILGEKGQVEGYFKGEKLSSSVLKKLKIPLKTWTKEQFEKSDMLIFIGATGIATRSISPYVKSKDKDPGVLVIDEGGNYVIPLLSGHIGGANEEADFLGEKLKALPVITTATDLQGKLAIDSFAAKRGLYIKTLAEAKHVAAAFLTEEEVGFISPFPLKGKLAKELSYGKDQRVGVVISGKEEDHNFQKALYLIPKIYTLGIGCRKNTPKEKIQQLVDQILKEEGIHKESVEKVTSIDLKKEEPGLVAFARERNLPFKTYSGKALGEVKGEFTSSSFVKGITGVDNVCERAASYQGEKIIVRKVAKDGVTLAIGQKQYIVKF